jgi:hypothetical protein
LVNDSSLAFSFLARNTNSMTQQRYNLIKKICEQKNSIDEIGQLPYNEDDLQDELCRFNTTPPTKETEWEIQFVQNLIFGTY